MTIASGYTKQEMLGFSELFAITTMALEENPDQDFLGHLYMGLELGNKNTGQFFTPFDVAKMCASVCGDIETIENEIERHHFAATHDCCIGGGAMMIGFASILRERGINYQRKVLFVGMDIDHTCCCMSYIQLSLLGCPGYIVCGDSLSQPLTGDTLFAPMDRETFITPMYCAYDWDIRRRYHLMARVLGLKPAETRGESDSQSDNIETCSDEENTPEPVATHEMHEETHASDSETETNTSSSDEMIQLTFFD